MQVLTAELKGVLQGRSAGGEVGRRCSAGRGERLLEWSSGLLIPLDSTPGGPVERIRGQVGRRVDDGEQLLKTRELTGGGPVRFRQLQGYWSRGRARGASRQRGETVAVAGQGWGTAGWHSHGGAGRSVRRSSVVWWSEGSRALSWARCGAREAGWCLKGGGR